MNTLKVTTTFSDVPVPSALVRLSGDASSLTDYPDAALALDSVITWTREITGFSGNRWNCWQKYVAQEVAAITWQEFREQVLDHNPSLRDSGGRFAADGLYFLPENCLPANTTSLVAWDRELSGFDGTVWECWQQHVRGKVLGLSWDDFAVQFRDHNPDLGKQGKLRPRAIYLLPRTLGGDKFYLAGYTDGDGTCQWESLPAGAYSLSVSCSGLLPWSRDLALDGEITLHVELDAAAQTRAAGFVEVKKDKAGAPRFFFNGNAFPFIGVNLRGLLHYGAEEWKHHDQGFLGSSEEKQIVEQLQHAQQMGALVVRVFAASRHASPGQVGNRLERVLKECQRLGLYVIAAFTDLYQDTPLHPQGDDGFYTVKADSHTLLNEQWFKGGYRQNYLPLIDHVVSRFANHPNIFAWEVGNELKLDNQPEAFLKFVHDVARHIGQLDRNHLITTGMISTHHVHMKHRQDLQQQLYRSPDIHFLTVHAYNRHMDSEKVEGDDPRRDQKVHKNDDSQLAREVGKPFIVEEAGVDAGKGTMRGGAIAEDMRVWFERGAQGYMQWGFMAPVPDNGDGDQKSGMDRGKFHDDWDDLFRTYRDKAGDLARQAGGLSPAPNQPAPKSNGKTAALPVFKAGQTVFTTKGVNLRHTPNGDIARLVPVGTSVTVLGESQQSNGFVWWKVRIGAEEGWMAQAAGNTTLLSLT